MFLPILKIILNFLPLASLATPSPSPKLSAEQRLQLQKDSLKADESINFLQFGSQIEEAISGHRTALVFFGAAWCVNTQKLTPKYLKVQQKIQQSSLFQTSNFTMGKVECSLDQEVYCMERWGIDGFPTLLVFVDGKLYQEYPDTDETTPLYDYIVRLTTRFPAVPPSSSSTTPPVVVTNKNAVYTSAGNSGGIVDQLSGKVVELPTTIKATSPSQGTFQHDQTTDTSPPSKLKTFLPPTQSNEPFLIWPFLLVGGLALIVMGTFIFQASSGKGVKSGGLGGGVRSYEKIGKSGQWKD